MASQKDSKEDAWQRRRQQKRRPSKGNAASSRKGVKKMKVSSLKSYMEKRKTIQSINPYTEEVMQEIPLLTRDEIDQQIERSRQAFIRLEQQAACRSGRRWSSSSASICGQEKRKYAELITKEMGKAIKESLAEVEKCAWLCDYYADNAERMLAPEEIKTENKKSSVIFQPLGVALAIMPWNFPYWQAFRFGIPAVTAGNVIVLKHASNVPQTALSIEDAFSGGRLPGGRVQDPDHRYQGDAEPDRHGPGGCGIAYGQQRRRRAGRRPCGSEDQEARARAGRFGPLHRAR